MTNLELAEKLYFEKGLPMLREKFPSYADRIAAGFAGEGSDCFGYDDAVSRDHDFGPGFCLWLTAGDYARIGEDVNREYAALMDRAVREDPSIAPSGYDPRLNSRRGARSIKAFYQGILRIRVDEEHFALREADWLNLEEQALATATNGAVFRDEAGLFSAIRAQLAAYYPETVWKRRLIHEMREFSQYGQSNYARSMARGDLLTASLCRAKGTEAALKLVFLLNRRYAPYYKWLHRASKDLPRLQEVCAALEEITALPPQTAAWKYYRYDSRRLNTEDAVEAGFERVAALIAAELSAQGLTEERDREISFLEYLAGKMAAADAARTRDAAAEKERLAAEIVRHEWQQFDRVHNEGGRADCQDDWKTFEIMRTAQYRNWEVPLLSSYLQDLKDAEERGWNLVTEKYARMMQSTDPEGYAELADRLPERSGERLAAQEEVIAVHVAWNEEMAAAYPRYSGGGRPIHSEEDSPWETSSETYLRGELSTYSDRTFALYRDYVLRCRDAGVNLVEKIAQEQVKQYGYRSLAEVEEGLKR